MKGENKVSVKTNIIEKWVFAFLLGICLFSQASLAAKYKTECKYSVAGRWNISFCITKDPESTNPDFLYFLHGIFGNTRSWETDGASIREEWAKAGIQAPTVISLSAGPAWLLSYKNVQPLSGLLEVFINSLIPEVENYLGGLKGQRYLMGISMGGFNAIQLFSAKPEWFKKVALISPAIPSISPFSSPTTIWNYVRRTGARIQDVLTALAVGIIHFPSDYLWQQANPLQLVKKMNSNFPEIYVGAASSDCYGFQEGDIQFADIALNVGVHILKHSYSGQHGEIKSADVVQFLQAP